MRPKVRIKSIFFIIFFFLGNIAKFKRTQKKLIYNLFGLICKVESIFPMCIFFGSIQNLEKVLLTEEIHESLIGKKVEFHLQKKISG